MKQANKNFLTNIIHLIVNIAVGVLYTPYLVRSVGVVAYGVVPLALIINQYINVISLSLVNALTRFYSIEYRNGNFERASRYFSTSIVVGVIFSMILYPILYISIGYIDQFFNIPSALLYDAKLLFRFTVAGFFISVISNCINTTLFADNLLDYVNYLKITRQSLKFLLNVAFFVFLEKNIFYIGLSTFITELAVLLLSVCFYRHTKPVGVHFNYSLYSRTYLITMFGMVVWVLLQRFSDTFLYKIDSLLMNLYFGIKMTGIIGAVSEFGTYVTSVTTILSSLFAPLLLICYSKKQWTDYKQMTVDGAYIVGLFSGLLCALLCGSAPILLELWLGHDFADYGLWMIIKLVVIPYTTAGAMFANGYLYANYNKRPAIVSLLLAIFNVLVNICLLHMFSSVDMFLVVCLVFVLLQGLCMNIWFYNRIYKSGFATIVRDIVKYTLYMLLMMSLTYIVVYLFSINTLLQLFTVYSILFIVGLVMVDSVFLKPSHREILITVIPVYGSLREGIIKVLKRS